MIHLQVYLQRLGVVLNNDCEYLRWGSQHTGTRGCGRGGAGRTSRTEERKQSAKQRMAAADSALEHAALSSGDARDINTQSVSLLERYALQTLGVSRSAAGMGVDERLDSVACCLDFGYGPPDLASSHMPRGDGCNAERTVTIGSGYVYRGPLALLTVGGVYVGAEVQEAVSGVTVFVEDVGLFDATARVQCAEANQAGGAAVGRTGMQAAGEPATESTGSPRTAAAGEQNRHIGAGDERLHRGILVSRALTPAAELWAAKRDDAATETWSWRRVLDETLTASAGEGDMHHRQYGSAPGSTTPRLPAWDWAWTAQRPAPDALVLTSAYLERTRPKAFLVLDVALSRSLPCGLEMRVALTGAAITVVNAFIVDVVQYFTAGKLMAGLQEMPPAPAVGSSSQPDSRAPVASTAVTAGPSATGDGGAEPSRGRVQARRNAVAPPVANRYSPYSAWLWPTSESECHLAAARPSDCSCCSAAWNCATWMAGTRASNSRVYRPARVRSKTRAA
jgi:hypothetical protein